MDIISMDLQVFNALTQCIGAVEAKAGKFHRDQTDLGLKPWLDGNEVCGMLGISKRTLQTYRDSGKLPFSRVEHKMYYSPTDVQKFLDSSYHQKPSLQ